MADLENALSGILSDPDAMMKIKALGEQLGLTGSSENSPANNRATSAGESALHTDSKGNQTAPSTSNSPLEMLTRTDPALLSKITGFLPMLSNMNKQDETTALLCALRPFLSAQRRKRLEEAEKILRIMKVLPFIRKSGLF